MRLSSVSGPVGIDFEFDELFNDGYGFDARGIVVGPGTGRTATRVQGGRLRGEFADGVRYALSFRRFESVWNGDLTDPRAEQRREGHVAVARTSVGRAEVSIFERSHGVSVPDSATTNHTAGFVLSAPVGRGPLDLRVGAGYEDIRSLQSVGEERRARLEKAHAGAECRASLPAEISIVGQANATHYVGGASGWGAGVRLGRALGAHSRVLVDLCRRFRMPNLGELFGPRHRSTGDPSLELAGNEAVQGETAVEAAAAWSARVGPLYHEIRATAIRVYDPILYMSSPREPSLAKPTNAGSEDLRVVESRARVAGSLVGSMFEIAGSFEYAPDEKGVFFEGVPDYRATAYAAFERDVFKKSSAVRLSAEYQRCGGRKAGSSEALPAYDVWNLKLTVRLIDARLYVQWLNVADEKYQTVWPYLMTPRTFVYGVEWTIFD